MKYWVVYIPEFDQLYVIPSKWIDIDFYDGDWANRVRFDGWTVLGEL